MKKKYIKPVIIFEEFSLSTNIAAGCDSIVGNPSEGICGVYFTPTITIFNVGLVPNCNMPAGEEGLYNGFCYHAPTDENNLFNS